MNRTALVGLVVVASSGCQSYEFQRVEPFAYSRSLVHKVVAARASAPNRVLLIDNSASMAEPTSAGGPTRIEELKRGMSQFLSSDASRARVGLSVFPTGAGSCSAPGRLELGLPPNDADDDLVAIGAQAAAVGQRIAQLVPQGGTPTAAALRALLDVPELTQSSYRDNLVILVTDGLPNCNEANPNNVCGGDGNAAACACTSGSCTGSTCALGCLDQTAAVNAISQLRARGIRTAVVGFGADVAGEQAATVLEAMARAGGAQRPCAPAGPCGRSFYSAADAKELIAALTSIVDPISPCLFPLAEGPTDVRALMVGVDGQQLPSGAETWRYDPERTLIEFTGSTCARLEQSTNLHPVVVDVSLAQAVL